LLVQKRAVTSSSSRPNTSTSATFDQTDHTMDEGSIEDNASGQNRNERSPTPYGNMHSNLSHTLNEGTTFTQELHAAS
ncbi:unnamed protein product, partial [Adineta steineri]